MRIPIDTEHNLEILESNREEPVFHQMRNILNSIHVSTGVIHQQLLEFHLEDVGRVADMLEVHVTNLGWYLSQDPKGRKIPRFLGQLSQNLIQKHLVTLKELNTLHFNLEQLEGLVNAGQSKSQSERHMDPVQFSSIMDEAVAMYQEELERLGVTVVRDYQSDQNGLLEMSKLHHILGKVIRVAIRAMQEFGDRNHRLTLRVMICPDRENFIRLQIEDTGIGIPAELLTQVYAQPSSGQTLKPFLPNHYGSALTAKELGGSLRVWSEGPHHGTLVTLDIPVIHMGEIG